MSNNGKKILFDDEEDDFVSIYGNKNEDAEFLEEMANKAKKQLEDFSSSGVHTYNNSKNENLKSMCEIFFYGLHR
jgi:hypothetical protein